MTGKTVATIMRHRLEARRRRREFLEVIVGLSLIFASVAVLAGYLSHLAVQ